MLERTKKPRTEKITILTFREPESNRRAAIESLSRLGFVDTSESIPRRDAFPVIEFSCKA